MTSNSHSLRVLNLTGCKVVTDEFLKPLFAANKSASDQNFQICTHVINVYFDISDCSTPWIYQSATT